MSGLSEKELGKTLEIYRRIAIILNGFPRDRTISIGDLAKRADVHWNTARKALLLLNAVNKMTPRFELESASKFRIVKKPNAFEAVEGIFESLEMRIVVKLMLRNATEERTAQQIQEFLREDERQVLQDLVSKGFVNSSEGRFYLSKRGQSLASLGMRELVEYGIELPWEKPEEGIPPTVRRQIGRLWAIGDQTRLGFGRSDMFLSNFIEPRKYNVWQVRNINEGWQFSSERKEKALCYAK